VSVGDLLAHDDDDNPLEAVSSAAARSSSSSSSSSDSVHGNTQKERARAAVDALREFHRGRRRFKAMLLAVMLGYADAGLERDQQNGTACLGSRRAAMEVFDADQDGVVTVEDVKRVARYLGEDLTPQEIGEMMRALDTHCRPSGHDLRGISTSRMRNLLPPLYPAHSLQRGDVVFSAGEIDPRFYVLLQGDVLVSHTFTLRPRPGYVQKVKQQQKSSSKKGGDNVKAAAQQSGFFGAGSGGSLFQQKKNGNDRQLSLGLHRLETGESFGETELLEASVTDALPRASTATCASSTCELLSIPGHLFQLLSDVFDGVQTPLRKQAEARAKSLVWSWVGALVAHSVGDDLTHGVATRSAFEPGDTAWLNRVYSKDSPLGRSLELLQKHGGGATQRRVTAGGPFGADTVVKPSRFDAFLVVEDGVVEVTVADARTGARRVHTLWPRDFVYCNERPFNHPLDAKAEFSATVVVDVTAVTSCQLAFVHGDVFQQALNQPAMQFVKIYLVDRFRELPPVDSSSSRHTEQPKRLGYPAGSYPPAPSPSSSASSSSSARYVDR